MNTPAAEFTLDQWNEYHALKAKFGTPPPKNGHTTATPAPAKAPETALPATLRLDLGCGKAKREGFTGVDVRPFPGVDIQWDLAQPDGRVPFAGQSQTYRPWPWKDSTVDEVHCSHTVEHLQFNPEHPERIHFVNELHRVLKPGAKATIIVPHWASCRMYGDYTHREPVSEFWLFYLSAAWRKDNAPHCDLYTCDFDAVQPGYSPHPEIQLRSFEYQQHALKFWREAAQDMIFTLVKRA